MRLTLLLIAVIRLFAGSALAQAADDANGASSNRVTILYDAFSNKPELKLDWGYAALVEFEGKRILFDTGNNADTFEANVRQLHVDLRRIDAVVLSHRHGDHTSGLRYVLSINPNVTIYAPRDEPFATATPMVFFKNSDGSLPPKMRYFAGKVPQPPPGHGTAWPGTSFHNVEGRQNISDQIHLVSTVSETPGFREMPEVSLVLDTARGPIVIVGCSHPGIENILANVTQQIHIARIYEVIGGMHLLQSPPGQVEHTLTELFDRYQVKRMAPGHCTGEQVFALLQKRLGADYIYAGTGEVIALP